MQAFEVLWLRWLLIMTVVGLGLTLALFLGFYLPARAGRPPAREQTEHFAAGIEVANRGIPLLLVLLYLGIFIFMVSYVLCIWRGKAGF